MTALQILVQAGQPRAQLGRGRESFFKELVEIARKVMAERYGREIPPPEKARIDA